MKASISLMAAGFLLAAASSGRAQTNFTRVTTGPLVTTAGHFSSCAWGDYDNDGLIDLFVGGGGVPDGGHNYLFHNEGYGEFTSVSQGAIVTDVSQSYGNSWGDYDNDGFLDLFVGNSYSHGDRSFLYHNNGNGTFTRITTGPVADTFGYCSGCAWADFDRDGFLDLFVCNSGSPNLLYHNKGNGTFDSLGSGEIVRLTGDSLVPAWADYDNDGWPDLFVARGFGTDPQGQPSLLYRNNRNGTFARRTSPAFNSDAQKSVSAAWGDYDNDGFQDLVVVNSDSENSLYHNNGDGTFTQVTAGSIAEDAGSWLGCAWGDYDNDGYLDLFVGGHPGPSALYHNNGDGTFTKIQSGPIVEDDGLTGGCAWGDYDNDGFLDLIVTKWWLDFDAGIPGQNLLYHNLGNSNAWLKVRCVGTASNRSAIGAKVRARATIDNKTFWQMREITPGDGFNGNSLEAHFGLGNAAVVDTLSIEWPSGAVQVITNVPARQTLTVIEPARLQALKLPGKSSFQLQLLGGAGNSYDLEITSDLRNWLPWWHVSLTNRSISFAGTNAAAFGAYRAILR